MINRKTITVFEHESIYGTSDGVIEGLTKSQLETLQRFYKERDFPYYTLVHNGVKFSSYVGVLQVGGLVIEVLPKADKVVLPNAGQESMESSWRKMLIGMLQASGLFNVSAPSSSRLAIRPNNILDLYIGLFVHELEYLLQCGLIKKYRKTRGNVGSVKGRIVFSQHVQRNYVHQERTYSEYTEYTRDHLLHSILYKALRLLPHLNASAVLSGRIQSLLFSFPEVSDVHVHESTFDRIDLSRNSVRYRPALNIARLLLLNYHPDITRGSNDVLALMFDMNLLWERFVYASLKMSPPEPGKMPKAQDSMAFWKPNGGGRVTTLQPDIWFEIDEERFIVDTKWKNIQLAGVSPDDLRQMYAYLVYFDAAKVAIVYPDTTARITKGRYFAPEPRNGLARADEKQRLRECTLLGIPINTERMSDWQAAITQSIRGWAGDENVGVG